MVQIETDKPRKLLKFRFAGRVTVDEFQQNADPLRTQLSEMEPGFRLLTDLSRLDHMDPGCAPYIEQNMEMCDQKGVSKIVRVIPNPMKDIGFNIMSMFHYRRGIPIVTCKSLEEASEVLAG